MKKKILFGIAALVVFGAVAFMVTFSTNHGLAQVKPPDDVKMPEVIVLGKDSKLGQVTFNHVKHNGGAYSIDGTGPIGCVECHHTAQPAAELLKHPPLKTAWPTDRTTTLTADLFAKGAALTGVAACRDCHARAGEKPKLLATIPEIKHESSTAIISLTNQQALHRNCAGCHTEIAKTNKLTKGPTNMQCTTCHKKTA
ncbi:MAG TPA: cytochrome c3 family protein [Pyrinomonadaceae bacterium]|nr:cytochrome c3 family protein [Acidobacteriota bacterium]HQZ97328.1 cytochrome c3 family protein [Pyrinomonadaceae bacterium]